MKESILFNSPLILVSFGLALFFCIIELNKKVSGWIFPLISVILFAGSLIILLLNGGTLQESLIIALIFLLLNIQQYKREGDKDDI